MDVAVAINYTHKGKQTNDSRNWKEFNSAFQNVVVSTDKLLEAICAGHAHCAVHRHVSHRKMGKDSNGRPFPYSGAYRDYANFEMMQTACLDFDRMDQERDSIGGLLWDPFIGRNAAILYATSSSTPEKPRTRVVFALEKPVTDVDDARLFNRALTSHYPRADQSGSDVMKAWSGSLNSHEVCHNPDAFISDAMVRGMITLARRQEEEIKRKRAEFLDGMEPNEMRDKLRDALAYVPPQMDYNDWLKALMAIWTIFPGEDGVALAESWSPGKIGEIAQKFRLMRDVRIGPDWIFAVAYKRGWRDPNKKYKQEDIVSLLVGGGVR